jgi:hypothetical protein
MRLDKARLVEAACRNEFASFIRKCFHLLTPGAPFHMNWHILATAYHLEQVRLGTNKRLIINMPPRSLKSIMSSVALSAFILGHDPTKRVIAVSYGSDLAIKHANDFRAILNTAIGIVKGKPFAPDARMKNILTEAVAVANATARSLFMNPHDQSWAYYPDSAWVSPLFTSGYEFETPIPIIEGPVREGKRIPEGVKPFPKTGYRTLDVRTFYFYSNVAMSPALAMRMTGVGSQYLYGTRDENNQYLDGAKVYKVILPKGIPAASFWSLTLYDNQSRSMLDTPQLYPRAGSQSYPSPAAEPNADGSTTVYFSPLPPEGIKRGNWIQTMPKKGYFVILRLYSPLEPFFDKTWRPSEIELVR